MGFWDKATRAVKGTVSGQVTGSGAVIDGLKTLSGGKRKRVKRAKRDKLNKLNKKLRREADQFRENLPEYKSEQMQGLIPAYREAEKEGTRKVREGASRRGLLYSGLAKEKEGEFRGQLASQLAKQKTGINVEAEELARKKEKAAAASGLQESQQLMQEAENYYNIAMQNQIQRRKALGSLMSGLGYAAGTYAGTDGTTQGNQQGLMSGNQYGPYQDYGGYA